MIRSGGSRPAQAATAHSRQSVKAGPASTTCAQADKSGPAEPARPKANPGWPRASPKEFAYSVMMPC